MELRDLIVTPIVIIFIYGTAIIVRPFVTDELNRVYFIPALTVKIIGALAVGFIYQFYYDGGDTFNYHTWGSRYIWEAMMESPSKGLKLLFSDGSDLTGIYEYSSKILFFKDPASYAVVKFAAILDLFTASTYSATAVLFATFSFVGIWAFYLVFYQRYPHLGRQLAFAAFFIPSVFFWGSGLLKDTITIGFLGLATYQTNQLFVLQKKSVMRFLILVLSFYGLYLVKMYILLIFIPALIVWIFLRNLSSVHSTMLKLVLLPFVLIIAATLSYFAMLKVSEDNEKYALSSIARTAQITAYDIRFWTGRDAGSGYTLGELDGSFVSMMRLSPQAINVSLFRPYLWEVKNPLMLLSALESFFFLVFCVYILFAINVKIFECFLNPDITFSFLFSICFAFAVGVSTYNFGTLVRYKIPLLPFFAVCLILILNYSKSERKFKELEATE